MVFRGRTVLTFILLAMFASSLMTMTVFMPQQSESTTSKSNGKLSAKDIEKLQTTFGLIDANFLHKADHEKLMNGAINGMLATLDDPFTSYMDQKEAQQFNESVTSSFQGIGAEVSMDDNKVKIISPIKGSPAEKAGLKANDVILAVNGEKLDGLTLTQAVMKIRGPKGTQAKLTILRVGSTEPIEMIVIRDDIPVETVYGDMLAGNVGKLEIRQFSTNTAVRFKEELVKLESNGMKALIIDVRDDPGGILPVVVDIASNFVENGKTIVQIEDRDGKKQLNPSDNKTGVKKYPIAILVNGGSASASEILAGALKESVPGAIVVGTATYGKGTVQVTYEKEMGDGSNLKLTSYKWLTPLGNWIHTKGIEPTLKVEQPDYFNTKPFSRKTILQPDMVGDDVKTLQVILKGLGYPIDRTDGYFSAKTAQAVAAFQKDQGITADSKVDMVLMDKMEKALIVHIRDPKNDAQLNAALAALQDKLKGK